MNASNQALPTPTATAMAPAMALAFASSFGSVATWRDPACVSDWAPQLPAGREVIDYCVYGHEVGRVTAMRLRAQGVNARFLEDGIDGWQGAGHRTVPKGETS
jgi:superoxide dismutase, Fe-Mn family